MYTYIHMYTYTYACRHMYTYTYVHIHRYMYTYVWLIHVDVWQKPMQYCKAITLQLKTNFLKKMYACSGIYTS